MEITSVRVRKITKENSKLRGIASIAIDNAIAIHDIRIIEGNNGLFVAMPSRKTATGEYKDVCHPINQEIRDEITNCILDEYNKTTEE